MNMTTRRKRRRFVACLTAFLLCAIACMPLTGNVGFTAALAVESAGQEAQAPNDSGSHGFRDSTLSGSLGSDKNTFPGDEEPILTASSADVESAETALTQDGEAAKAMPSEDAESIEPAAPSDAQIPQEEVKAVVETLYAKLDTETLEKYKDFLSEIQNNSNYAKESVHTAFDQFLNLMDAKTLLEQEVSEVKSRIQNSSAVDAAICDALCQNLNSELSKFPADYMELLNDSLVPIQEEPTASANTSLTADQLEKISQFRTVLSDFLDVWADFKALSEKQEKLSVFSTGFTGQVITKEKDPEQIQEAGQVLNDLGLTLSQLLAQYETLSGQVKSYFTLDSDSRKALSQEISLLSEDMDSFLYQAAADFTNIHASQLRMQVEEHTANRKNLSFALVALALGVLSLTLGIVSLIFALRKPQEQPADFSETASRQDVEALQQQHRVLLANYSLLEQTAARSKAESPEISNRIDALENRIASLEPLVPQPLPTSDPPESTPPIKEAPPVEKNVPKCYLRLDYQHLSPDLSVLIPDPDGDYALFNDGTLLPREPRPGFLQNYNNLPGWKASGVLYLFNLQQDGVECSSEGAVTNRGFFQLKKTVRPATVKSNGNNYQLQEKGCIEKGCIEI